MFRDDAFNLCKFRTNTERLQLRINKADQSHFTTSQEAADGPNPSYSDESYASATFSDIFGSLAGSEKVLGVQWRITDDCIVFDASVIFQIARTLQPTKRNVVSTAYWLIL